MILWEKIVTSVASLAFLLTAATQSEAASSKAPKPQIVKIPDTPKCPNVRLPEELGGLGEGSMKMGKLVTKKAIINVAIAKWYVDKKWGLACVDKLNAHTGMLFVFAHSSPWTFWMLNTKVPLDIVWIDADGTVNAIAKNLPAADASTTAKTAHKWTATGLYVMEIPAGEAARDGITKGNLVILPQV